MATRRRKFINRWLTWICLGIFLAAFWILFGQPDAPEADPDFYGDSPVEEVSLGVLGFTADGVEEAEATEISDRLRLYLQRTRRMHVLMKNEVEAAVRMGGSAANDLEVGRMMMADLLITGTLSGSGRRYQLNVQIHDVWEGMVIGSCYVETSGLENLLNLAAERVAETLANSLNSGS